MITSRNIEKERRVNNVTVPGGELRIVIDVDAFVNSAIDEREALENYSPVFQKPIGIENMKNIQINGSFRTDFDIEQHHGMTGMAYITVRRRNSGVANAQGGYGIAFRPSSPDADVYGDIESIGEGTITLHNIEGSFPSNENIAYIEKDGHYIAFHYSDIVGTTLQGVDFPVNVTPEDNDRIYMAEANVFLVDSSITGREASGQKFLEYENGIMPYIRSSSFLIERDTDYDYRLVINDDNSVDFSIDSGEGFETVMEGPAYLPLDEYLQTEGADSFGISVVNTCGHKWYWSPITISSISGEFAALYMEMSVENMTNNIVARFAAGGVGYDEGIAEEGVEVYVYEPAPGDGWTMIADNDIGELFPTPLVETTRSLDVGQYSENNVMRFYIKTRYPSGGSEGQNATLWVNTFYLESGTPDRMNIGGMTDVYIDDEDLQEAVVEEFQITNSVGIISDPLGVVVDLSIENQVEGFDYLWEVDEEEHRYSTRASNRIRFPLEFGSQMVSLTYRYSNAVPLAQNMAESPYHSFKANDIIIKHMPIYWITAPEQYRADINDHINQIRVVNNTLKLSWEGVYSHLSRQNVEITEPLVMSIRYRERGFPQGTVLSAPGDFIVVPKTATFRIDI